MRTLHVVLMLLALSTASRAQSERSLLREGNSQYKKEQYSDAEVSYKKALEKSRESTEGSFNLGDALYKQDRFDESAEQFRVATMRSDDAATRAGAFHNLGNALVKSEKIQDGIEAYKQALRLNPADDDTRYNLALAKRMLQQQQNRQEKQQKNDQDQDKNKQNEQQNKQQDQQQQQQGQQNQQQQQQQQGQQTQQNQQQEQGQQQQAQKQDQGKGQQAKKMMISKKDAERLLEALRNEEKNVQKKVQRRAPARVKVEKDW